MIAHPRARALRLACGLGVALALALALAASACEGRKPGGGDEPPSRVNAAPTAAKQAASTEAFCDAHFAPGAGPALAWPALAPGAQLAGFPAAAGAWRWINLWATWCKPCVEELPRLLRWRDRLTAGGTRLELAFVSVDESDAEVAAFRARHPDAPPSARLADPAKGTDWVHALGLAGDPPIPLHFFVAPDGRVRCARAGGVREQDLAAIEKLLAE